MIGEGGDGDENGDPSRVFGDGCDMFDDQDHDDPGLVFGDVSGGDKA